MPRPKNKTGIPMHCHICGYKWLTQSKGYYVCCPRCHRQIPIPGRKVPKAGAKKKPPTSEKQAE